MTSEAKDATTITVAGGGLSGREPPPHKRQRVERGMRNVLTWLVRDLGDTAATTAIARLSDRHLQGIFSFLRPTELAVTRGINRSVAYVPVRWYLRAGLSPPMFPPDPPAAQKFDPAAAEAELEQAARLTFALEGVGLLDTSCDELVRRRLARRAYRLGAMWAHGIGGDIFEVCATTGRRGCADLLLKRMPLSLQSTERDLRIHKHLVARVPDVVPTLHAAFACGDHAYMLMERLGETLLSRQAERAFANDRKFRAANDFVTDDEAKALVAAVRRVAEDGGVLHMDLHAGNVVAAVKTPTPPGTGTGTGVAWKVIDFGRAHLVDEVKTADDVVELFFERKLPPATDDASRALRHDAEYLLAHRVWLGVAQLFEPANDDRTILRHRDAAAVLPADFLAALRRVRDGLRASA